jgi:L-amino acid N-acyltransferase YncA
MKIRVATMDDIPALLELGRSIHATTRFRLFKYSPARVADNLAAVIQDKRGIYCFLVAEDARGVAVGVLVGCLERHIFSDEQLVATLIHYDVLPEKRMGGAGLRLLSAFRQWAENRGAFELNAGISSGTDLARMDRFMRRLGFEQTGGNYSLILGKPEQGNATAYQQ